MSVSASSVIAGAAYVKIAMDNAELSKGLEQSQTRLRKFITALNGWSSEVAIHAAMLQLPFKKALDVFADFDLKMRQVKAITGATGKAMDDLSEHARKLGRETSFTTSQVAGAMVTLGRLGFSLKEVKDATRPVMNLAKATGTELADAAQVAGNNMRVFGMKTSDMGHIADIITSTVNGSAQTLSDFAEASAKAGPNFVHTGSDMKEMAASLGVLANMGIRGALGGTALSRSIKRLADPRVKEFLRSYAIEVENLDGTMKPLHKNLAQIGKMMATLSHSEKIHVAETIFEVRGSLAGLPLAASAEAIDNFISRLQECNGVAASTSEEMDTGIYGALMRLESAFNDVYISAGKLMSTSWISVIENISKTINVINTGLSGLSTIIKTVVDSTASMLILGTISKLALLAVSSFKLLFQPLLKLDAIVSGTAKNAELSIRKEQELSLASTARVATQIANEKRLTAVTLAENAKRERDTLAGMKKEERESYNSLTEGRDKSAKADEKIAKKTRLYHEEFDTLEKSVAAQTESLKTISQENKELKEKLSSEQKSLDNARKEFVLKSKLARKAAEEVDDAGRRLSSAQNVDARNGVISEKSGELNLSLADVALKKKAADEAYKASIAEESSIKNSISLTKQKIAQEEKTIQKFTAKLNEGDKRFKGLAAAHGKNLVALQKENYELSRHLETQTAITKQTKVEMDNADSLYKSSQRQSNAVSRMDIGKPVVNEDAIKNEIRLKNAALETAVAEKDRAFAEVQSAKQAVDAASEASDASNRLLASKKKVLASDKERLLEAQKMKDQYIMGENEIKAAQERENVNLRGNFMRLKHNRIEQQKAYNEARRAAEAARKEAELAEARAKEAVENARRFSSPEDRTAKNNEALEAAQAARDAAAYEVEQRKITLAKATETKQRIQQSIQEHNIEMSVFKEESAMAVAAIQSARDRAADSASSAKAKIKSNYEIIESERRLQASLRATLADVKAQKAAFMQSASFKRGTSSKQTKQNNTVLAGYDAQIEKLNALIDESVLKYSAAVQENTQQAEIMTDMVDKQGVLNDKLDRETEIRSRIMRISQNSFGKERSGWKSYIAAEKEFDAKMELERADNALASAEGNLSSAQKNARTASKKYAAVIAKGGRAHTIALAFSKRHAKTLLNTSAKDIYAASVSAGASKIRAAGYAAEAVAAKGVASALTTLAEHPIIAALTVLTTLYNLYNKRLERAVELSKNVAESHSNVADELAKERSSLEERFEKEARDIQYLRKLGQQSSLNEKQQETARKIIERLTSSYGELGIQIDSVTGQLEGELAAQKLVGEEQKRQMLFNLEKESAERKQAVAARQQAMLKAFTAESGITGGALSPDSVGDKYADILKKSGFTLEEIAKDIYGGSGAGLASMIVEWKANDIGGMSNDELQKYRDDMFAIENEMLKSDKFGGATSAGITAVRELVSSIEAEIETRKKIAAITSMGVNAEKQDDEYAEIVEAPTESETENNDKRLTELEKQFDSKSKTSSEREIDSISDVVKEFRTLSNRQIAYYENEMKIAEFEMEQNADKTDAASVANYERNKKRYEDSSSKVGMIQKRLDYFELDAEDMADSVSEAAKRKAERGFESDSSYVSGYTDATGKTHSTGRIFEEQQRQVYSSNEKERIDKLIADKNKQGALKLVATMIAANESELKKATKEYNSIVDDAKENGLYDGTMKESMVDDTRDQIQAVRQSISEMARRDTELHAKYREIEKAEIDAKNASDKSSSIGSFSASELTRAIGVEGIQTRIAKATEASSKAIDIIGTNVNLLLSLVRGLNNRLDVAGA